MFTLLCFYWSRTDFKYSLGKLYIWPDSSGQFSEVVLEESRFLFETEGFSAVKTIYSLQPL